MTILPDVIPRLSLPLLEIDPQATQLQLRAYPDGLFYRAHMDAPANAMAVRRAINFVYYFHRMPRAYTGCELVLFDSNIEADAYTRAHFTRVVPDDNSIIFFPSPYYHSVLPVVCPSKELADGRFAINGHFLRREPTAS